MNIRTLHLVEAMRLLDEWYDRAEMWEDIEKEHPWSKDACRGNALMCKTLGLVFHDRYKLLLDDK